MNIRKRLECLEKRLARMPCLCVEDMTDHELCMVIARTTSLTPEQVMALSDQDLDALVNELGKAAGEAVTVRVREP